MLHSQRRNYTADYRTWACFLLGAVLHWRRIRVGFWSHRDDLYLRSTNARRTCTISPRGEKGRKRVRGGERCVRGFSSFCCLFLLAFAVHKTTREVARNQQPSLSRWQIVARVRSRLSYARVWIYSCRVSALRALAFFLFPFHTLLIRTSDFFSPSYVTMHNCRWVSRVWSAAARMHIQMSVTRGRSCVGSRCYGGAR